MMLGYERMLNVQSVYTETPNLLNNVAKKEKGDY